MNWGTNSHDRTHHHWQGQKPSPAEHLFSHLFLSRRRAAATTAAGDPWEEQKLGQFRRNTKSTFQSCDNFIEKHTKTVVIILTRKIYVSDFFTIIICTKKNNSEFSPLLSHGCRCLISMFIFWRNDKKKKTRSGSSCHSPIRSMEYYQSTMNRMYLSKSFMVCSQQLWVNRII